jgi:hypothetical protein
MSKIYGTVRRTEALEVKSIITNLYRNIDQLLLTANFKAWEKLVFQFQIVSFFEVIHDSLSSSTCCFKTDVLRMEVVFG